MSRSDVLTSVRHLRGLLAAQRSQDDSDEQLLHAFAERRDDLAFTTLVRRHGPMVLGVCRRVLGHEQDAEDVFQATFVVLARRAATLRDKTTLAGFLYGTAHHLACKAKRAAGRRRQHEGRAPSGCLTIPRPHYCGARCGRCSMRRSRAYRKVVEAFLSFVCWRI